MKLIKGSLQGLNHLHEEKTLHRDIKPHNILISESLEPKIADFGIAEEIKPEWKTTITKGTCGYFPAEVYDSCMHSYWSDMFGLGCVIYELISGGYHPFGA